MWLENGKHVLLAVKYSKGLGAWFTCWLEVIRILSLLFFGSMTIKKDQVSYIALKSIWYCLHLKFPPDILRRRYLQKESKSVQPLFCQRVFSVDSLVCHFQSFVVSQRLFGLIMRQPLCVVHPRTNVSCLAQFNLIVLATEKLFHYNSVTHPVCETKVDQWAFYM